MKKDNGSIPEELKLIIKNKCISDNELNKLSDEMLGVLFSILINEGH